MNNLNLKPNHSSMTYYNTTNVNGDQREQFERTAKTQTEEVYKIFQRHYAPLTSWQVHKIWQDNLAHPPLITSIVRSLNTLEKKGLIRKTGNTMEGPYKRPNFLWEKTNTK